MSIGSLLTRITQENGMEVTFVNRQPRILGTCTGRRLLPGKHAHELEQEELNKILQNEQFKSWLALNWVVIKMPPVAGAPKEDVPEETPEVAPEDALQEVNLDEAKAMIAACGDPELLAVWHEKDRRKGAHEAIMNRLEALDAEANPPVDEDSDEGLDLEGDGIVE